MRSKRFGILLMCWWLSSSVALAEEDVSVYTFHVGINAPPKDSSLPRLRYADDDAFKLFLFMERFSKKSVLSTVLDTETQKDFPQRAVSVVPPRAEDIAAALLELSGMMAADREKGKRVIFYFTYSGHGERTTLGSRVQLLNGHIDKAWLKEKVLSLPADVVHLIIDACYAEGLVDARGLVKREVDATTAPVPSGVPEILSGEDLLEAFPHAGALVSATSDAEAYEWSELGAGVFTHELLSALAGAADVNNDGAIAYSEVAAFISAANRTVTHAKARPNIISHPPRIDRNIPIISFEWSKRLSFLKGVSSRLQRFHIETDSGRRILDAHMEPDMPFLLIVPPNEQLWLSNDHQSAPFTVDIHQTVDLSTLAFQAVDPVKRGSIANALHRGLFASQFGPAYYSGWIDSRGDVGVPMAETPPDTSAIAPASPLKPNISIRQSAFVPHTNTGVYRVVPLTLFATGALSLIPGGVFLGFGIDAKKTFDQTDIERDADDAKHRSRLYTGMAVGFLATSAIATSIAALVYRRSRKKAARPASVYRGE